MTNRLSLSKRAAIEQTTRGVGVSTTARLYVRQMVPEAAGMNNAELNEKIADNFASGTPVHRFKLTRGPSKGIGEIRQVSNLFYLAFVRGRGTAEAGYDIIAIQQSYKTPSTPGLEKTRLEPGWGTE